MTKKYKEIIESVECDICHEKVTGRSYVEITATVRCNEDTLMSKGTMLHSRGSLQLCRDCYIKVREKNSLITVLDVDTKEGKE